MDLSKLPLEIQIKVLNRVPESDLERAYNVSTAWREMIRNYQTKFANIDKSDWRWYCQHIPRVKTCESCYARVCSHIRAQDTSEWDWWNKKSV